MEEIQEQQELIKTVPVFKCSVCEHVHHNIPVFTPEGGIQLDLGEAGNLPCVGVAVCPETHAIAYVVAIGEPQELEVDGDTGD